MIWIDKTGSSMSLTGNFHGYVEKIFLKDYYRSLKCGFKNKNEVISHLLGKDVQIKYSWFYKTL